MGSRGAGAGLSVEVGLRHSSERRAARALALSLAARGGAGAVRGQAPAGTPRRASLGQVRLASASTGAATVGASEATRQPRVPLALCLGPSPAAGSFPPRLGQLRAREAGEAARRARDLRGLGGSDRDVSRASASLLVARSLSGTRPSHGACAEVRSAARLPVQSQGLGLEASRSLALQLCRSCRGEPSLPVHVHESSTRRRAGALCYGAPGQEVSWPQSIGAAGATAYAGRCSFDRRFFRARPHCGAQRPEFVESTTVHR